MAWIDGGNLSAFITRLAQDPECEEIVRRALEKRASLQLGGAMESQPNLSEPPRPMQKIGSEIVGIGRAQNPPTGSFGDYDARAHRDLALGNLFVELREVVKNVGELVRHEINYRKPA